MDDIRDPLGAEEFESRDREAFLRRRDFLQRTAMLAGLGGTMAGVLSADTLVEAAAAKQRARALPSPRNLPIDTFVVLMMENRSFDHYLGWLPGADGRQSGMQFADKKGQKFATHRLTTDFQGCASPDPDHSWEGGRTQLDGGKMDGFLRSGDNDVFSIGYYEEQDLPFIPHVAQEFTAFDRFFCSLLASTYPNRYFMHSGQSYGMKDNSVSILPDTTIFAALNKIGVSSRYFFTDIPVSALWGAPGLARSGQVQEYYARCATGTLPAVSFVDPSFMSEDGGSSGDEHPHGDVRTGQAFMADVVHAFMESPQYKTGALFIVYDEWGGFFDHVRPPRVPDIRSNKDINQDFGQMGIRIPAVTVSPYAKRGHVDHGIYGFESILKMIRYRFGLAPLTRRDEYAHNIAQAFDWDSKPRLEIPDLPRPPQIIASACGPFGVSLAELGAPLLSGGGGPGTPQPAARPKEHDLAALQTSGLLERLGFDFKPATAATTFRHPSSMKVKT